VTKIPGDPSIGGRLLFAMGFRLPPENREWVRHELTDAGWRGRTVLRHLIVMIPVCCALAALPGPPWLRVMVPLMAVAGSVFIVTAYADDIRITRLRQHKLPVPDDPDLGRPAH
jgi:hypothetical protein